MEKQEIYELTNPQKSIWTIEQYYKGSSINNICGTAVINEEVDFVLLEKAILNVLNENDIFKINFFMQDGTPKQKLTNNVNSNIVYYSVKNNEEFENLKSSIASTPISLSDSYPYNFYIFKMPDNRGAFMLNIHHILADSWTLGFISKEIIKAYSALLHNDFNYKCETYSYIDYITSEKIYQKNERFLKDKEYWNNEFENIPTLPNLPGSIKGNSNLDDISANRCQYTLDKDLLSKIKIYCQTEQISLYNFFMAIYALYIHNISGLNDFVIGTPILNRTNYKEKHTAGMFINMSALRMNFDNKVYFKDFVKYVSLKCLNMLKHQKYSYQSLIEDLRASKNSSVPNLYNTVFSYQVTNAIDESSGISHTTDWIFNKSCAENIVLQIWDINDSGILNISYDYKTSLYTSLDIENMHNRLLNIINQVISTENIKLSDVEIILPKEKDDILNKFNNTDFEYDSSKTLIDLFEDIVCKNPDKTAIIYDSTEYSYNTLNSMSNVVANYIISTLKNKGEKIAVLCKKSAWTVASFLGIMKSGNCYVPVDPEYPQDRIQYILENSECSMIISLDENEFSKNFKNKLILENLNIPSENVSCTSKAKPSDLAYMIYTSGTTGKPKGVKILHKNIINTLIWRKNLYKFDENITVYQIPSFSFDSSVEDIFTPLISGSKIVIPATPKVDINAMCNDIEKYNVNHFLIVPSLYKILLREKFEHLKTLKFITIAGEDFGLPLVKEHFEKLPNVRLINEYGPTENSVCSTYYELKPSDSEIFIGTPINNCKCYVLNNYMQLLPSGISGELYVSGPGVSEGYLNKPDITKERFLDNPFGGKYKLYKTGDIVEYSIDGKLKFIGRNDNQVKLHGFRIELKEIEQNILKNSEVLDVVVTKKEDSNNKTLLVAYVILKNKNFDVSILEKSLKNSLPLYMIPSIVKLDAFPLTPNGKIDTKALPLPDFSDENKEIVEPRDEFDEKLIDIVKKTLNVSNVSLLDTIFSLGGDSLATITLSARIESTYNVQIGIKELLSEYTIQDLSDFIKEHQNSNKNVRIEKTSDNTFYPISSAQRRIYYNTKMINHKNTVYNLPGYILIPEILDKEKICGIFDKIIKRHSTLRTSFVINEDDIVQKISDDVSFTIPVFENTESEIESIISKFPKPFTLEKAPLFRVELHYIDNKSTLILIDFHHIIMDGASLNLFIAEFNELYNDGNLSPLAIEYKDYAVWENNFNNSADIVPFEKYWLNKFEGSDFSGLNLPYDFSPVQNRTYKGKTISNIFDKDFFEKAKSVASTVGTSPYVLFLSAFLVLLYKYTGQKDIIIGTSYANRDMTEVQDLIGMFVNNIVVRGKINSDMSFKDFLLAIKDQTLDDLSNQPYPFDILIKKLRIPIDASKNPLFDVFFNYQNSEETSIKIKDKKYEIIQIANNISKFNLSLEIQPSLNKINLEYCTDLFKEDTVQNLFNHYINLVNSIFDNFDTKISDLSILSDAEKDTILYRFNDTKLEYDENKTISMLFEEQVRKTPNNIAVIFENKKLTYKELNEKANQLANYLRNKDIKPNDIIGIMLPRSLELLIAFLGVLKSGACYIPIDPTYPEKRIEYMLDNSNARLLLTTIDLYNNVDFENKVCITSEEIYMQNDKNLSNVNSPEDLAYLIYTSGSTGLPKGVMLKHKCVTNFAISSNESVDFLKDDCKYKNMVSVTTMSFDIFVFETLVCLQKGLKVVVCNEDEQRIPALLNKVIQKNNIELIQTTPSIMQIMLDNIDDMPNLHNLKYVNLIGEPLPLHLRDDLLKIGVKKIYNEYGPTETTVFSSLADVTNCSEIHIGKPIGNTQMYILDECFNPVPIGIAGELYIAGDGVAKGYLNKEDITRERFLKNPFLENSIMYKTGDLCKFDNNGNIYCLGRLDNQIKIRGLRIELEEIENQILSFPYIKKAKVVKQTIGSREIISAYYISTRRIKITELRKFLCENLPKYMVPTYFTALDDFPYTPNGKIDKNALPIPTGVLQNKNVGYIAPKTNLEIKLVSIWEDVLNTKPIGIKDNFFELGGDSILAMNLNIKLLKITDKIKYSDIFSYPTISELTEKIESNLSFDAQQSLEYSYQKYDNILINNMKNIKNIKPHHIGNILLTGATGFLGIHILADFLKTENGIAYVIIRKEPGFTIKEKLLNKLHYYFGTKFDKYINNRIILLEGDLTQDGFGLNQDDLFNLGNSIDVIINSAAKVSHYGNYQDFYNINVKSVDKIISFANLFKKEIFHISTLSVSGDTLDAEFSENDLYIGQSFDNVYVRSKFEAEIKILDSILSGTKAHILRVGNLMPRFSDGKFQDNISENAFIQKIETLLKLKVLPDYLENTHLEFSPVDSTSNAILKIVKYTSDENIIYHVFNHNYLYFKEFIKILHSLNIDIKVVNSEEFKQVIKTILNDPKSDILNSLINDLDKDLNLNYDNKIKTNSYKTITFLKHCGFEWPKIDKNYILKLLKLIKGE